MRPSYKLIRLLLLHQAQSQWKDRHEIFFICKLIDETGKSHCRTIGALIAALGETQIACVASGDDIDCMQVISKKGNPPANHFKSPIIQCVGHC